MKDIKKEILSMDRLEEINHKKRISEVKLCKD